MSDFIAILKIRNDSIIYIRSRCVFVPNINFPFKNRVLKRVPIYFSDLSFELNDRLLTVHSSFEVCNKAYQPLDDPCICREL